MGMKKCCICGGPIHDGRCRDCGMPYRDESKMYRLNESRPREQKSDAAVREERVRTEQKQERPAAGKKQSQQYQRGSAARSAAKSRTYLYWTKAGGSLAASTRPATCCMAHCTASG